MNFDICLCAKGQLNWADYTRQQITLNDRTTVIISVEIAQKMSKASNTLILARVNHCLKATLNMN